MRILSIFSPLAFISWVTLYFSGGSSESSSSQSTADNRVALSADNGSVGIHAADSTINVQSMDTVALTTAADVLKNVDTNNSDNVKAVLGLAGDLFSKSVTVLDKNQQLTQTTGEFLQTAYADAKGQTQDNKYLVAGALAVVGIVGFAATKGRK